MARWLLLLGGPLIWAAHFAAIYLLTSAAYVGAMGLDPTTRLLVVALSVLAIAAASLLAFHAVRVRDADPGFWRVIAIWGSLLAIVAVIWQTLPILALLAGTAQPTSS